MNTPLKTIASKGLQLGFRFICSLLAIVLVVDVFYKFSKNEDISLLKYTSYLKTENDYYPVISFCFKNPFLTEQLEKYGADEATYLHFLEGKNISDELLEIDYDQVTMDVNDYLAGYWISWVNGTHESFPAGSEGGRRHFETLVSFNGFINRQFFKCYSVNHKTQQSRRLQSIKLRQGIFQNKSRASYYSFVTLLHYPRQVLRSLGTLRRVWKERKNNHDYSMHFTLTGMDVMNRRDKQNDRCSPNWRNYDDSVIAKKIKNSGCIMPYETANMSMPKCKTVDSIMENNHGLEHYEGTGIQPPCRSVEKIGYEYVEYDLDSSAWAGQGHFWMSLETNDQKFKEIDQHR